MADREVLQAYVETGIRLELCFSELRNYNDRGTFFGKHPFITQASERDRVAELLRTNPTSFLDEFKNIDSNITRYRSHVKSKKYTEEQRKREEDNLRKYEALKAMYQEILDNTIKINGINQR